MKNSILFRQTAAEAVMQEDLFRRKATVHKLSFLLMPPMVPVNIFQLPRNAAVHYMAFDGISKGPRANDWEIRNVGRKMPMQLVLVLKSFNGNPIKLSSNIITEYDLYLRSEKIFRKSRDVVADDPGISSTVIYNYAYLPRMYRYTRTIFTEYHRWFNIFSTMLQTAVASTSDRTHFISLTLPRKLPAQAQMKVLLEKPDIAKIRELKEHSAWALFELWKWLNPVMREKSMFNMIPKEDYKRFIIMIEDAGKVTSFNLATLDSFSIKPDSKNAEVQEVEQVDQEEPVEKEEEQRGAKPQVIKGIELQKRFLYCLFTLVAQRVDAITTADDAEYKEEETDDGKAPALLLEEDDDTKPIRAPGSNVSTTNIVSKQEQQNQEEDNESEPSTQLLESQSVITNVEDEVTIAQKEQKILETLDADIETYDKLVEQTIVEESQSDTIGDNINERAQKSKVQTFADESKSVFDYLADKIDLAADKGTMTAVEYRKFNRHIENALNLESPYAPGVLAKDYATVAPVDTQIEAVSLAPDMEAIVDKSMRQQVFKELNDGYIEKFLNRDKVACVQAIQKAGYIVTGHTVKKTETVGGAYENHEIRIVPVEGVPSTVTVKAPVIDPDGKIKVGGNDYRYRWQRVDLPILKISASKVALSSYYGKNFVTRSEKAAYSYTRWLQKQINLKIQEGNTLSTIRSGNVFDHEAALPRAYSTVSQSWRSFDVGSYNLNFDNKALVVNFTEAAVTYLAKLDMVPFGKEKSTGTVLAMDKNNAVYKLKDGNLDTVGSFESFIGIDEETKPMEFTSCKLLGKEVPTGIVLGYYYGLSGLMKLLDIQARQVPAGTRANVGPDEWSLVFEDYTLVFPSDNQLANLILSGFNQASKALRKYSVLHFDQPAVYFNLLESMGLTGRYIREFDNLRDLFVDPITQRVLEKMGEPVTYPELVKRSTELLVDDKYKRPLDPTGSRYRGSERLAGAFYTQMVKSIREHRSKASRNTSKLDFNPYNVWKHVTTDSTFTMVKDINPINNLKEITAMTYSGHGGRNARSMTRTSRGMDPNDLGTLSEATVDSTDVGFNANLSMSPRIANMEGMILPPIGDKSPAASLLSPSALASPAINSDDAKRIAIAAIQHSHTVACKGYKPNPVRTGFETMIAHHVDTGYATTAKQDGTVSSKTKHGIVVTYKDGSTESIAIGRRFGNASGISIPHDMDTVFNEGDTFKAGAVLVYNKGFFRPDTFNKSQVNWMNGTIANIAFIETKKTHEDASSISATLADTLGASITKPKNVMIRFDQVVHGLVQEGDVVKYDDPVCIIEEASSAAAGLFDEESINTLKSVDSDAPLAGVSGIVDRVEVYYNGHPDELSDSLQDIVRKADGRLARRRKAAGLPIVTGQEDEGFNIEGTPLSQGMVCIRVFFTRSVEAAVGDKIVFGHQLKSEISDVYKAPITAVDGTPVDGFYGAKSLFGRNVTSPFKIGTTIKNLSLISKKMAEIYKGTKK